MPNIIFDGTEEFLEAIRVEFSGMGQPVVVIVGAAIGIGKALTEHYLKSGRIVIALDKLAVPPDWFKELKGDGFFIYNMDCSNVEEVNKVMNALFKEDKLAKIEAPLHLVATLGLNRLRWFKDGPHSSFREVIEANLLAPMILSSAFTEGVMEQNQFHEPSFRRSITFYSSIAGEVPMRTTAPYCSSKAGLNMLIRCLARELAPDIEVYGITLGPVSADNFSQATQMDDVAEQVAELRNKTLQEVWEETENDIPAGTLITIEEVINLQNQIIDGGNYSVFNSGTNFRLTGGRS